MLLKGIFENLSDDQLQEFSGEIIVNPNTLVLLANISDERANIVFACNEKMEGIDLNKMFKQFADADGRGGCRQASLCDWDCQKASRQQSARQHCKEILLLVSIIRLLPSPHADAGKVKLTSSIYPCLIGELLQENVRHWRRTHYSKEIVPL